MRVLKVPDFLYPHQRDLIKTVLEDREGKWFVVKSFRQLSGKSTCLENLVLIVALTRPKSVSVFIEPSNNQCSKVAGECYDVSCHLGCKFNSSTNILSFPNGSKIYFKSSEADTRTIRGYTVKRGGMLIVDEAQYVADEYYNALFPVVQKHKATMVLASTPDRQSGTFYNLYTRGLENDLKIVSLNWSQYLEKYYSQEELDFYKSVYSRRRFRTEVLGEFDISSGQVFTNLENCILDKPSDSKELYCGIDWSSGSGKDYTVITILNDKREVVLIRAFNDIAPMDQVDYIARLLQEYPCRRVLVEGNSIGSVFFDALKRKVSRIQKFNTSNDSKCRIVDQLVAHFEQEKIKIPYNEELLAQLRGFEEQTTKSGLRTYSCPPPLHDDFVMSLCIALEAATSNKGNYSIALF